MNKNGLATKHNLIIVGSARGVNKFYTIDLLMNYFNNAKVITTSKLISSILNDLNLPCLEKISLVDYSKYVEPTITRIILSHLEHCDVIVDTTFYYIFQGISAKEILKFYNHINKTILILVSDNPENIKQTNYGEWFNNINNLQQDILLNEYSFKFYISLFSTFSLVNQCEIKMQENSKENINSFLGGL
ncbi:MAG: hypothetical protein PHQ98_03540 [Candidatus ainarchaeum sp.]|nr:hypothetical protein [Candidatus ainarchaeum sp.]